jgi:uridine kinase
MFLVAGGYGSGKSYVVKKLVINFMEDVVNTPDKKLFLLYSNCTPVEANYKFNGIRV